MRLVVATEDRLARVDGAVYSHNLAYENFWRRYREVFESVLVVTRVYAANAVPAGWKRVDIDGVSVCDLPNYTGPLEYLKKRQHLRSALRSAFALGDAVIVRVPGTTGTNLLKLLPSGYPFGVEVVIDPWSALAPGSVRSVGRAFFRLRWTRALRNQCYQAACASYVTGHVLQSRYPPNPAAVTASYSSIDLPDERLIDDDGLLRRARRLDNLPMRLKGQAPTVRLGFVGSFAQNYKRPDIHIRAFARIAASYPNIVFEMIGAGPNLAPMQALAARLGLASRIIFRGKVASGDLIFNAMDSFDLLLHATAAEGLPRVVIEAFARGCPCIGTQIDGIPELVPPQWLVRPGDVAALTSKVVSAITEPGELKQYSLQCRRKAEEYTASKLTPRRTLFYGALRDITAKHAIDILSR